MGISDTFSARIGQFFLRNDADTDTPPAVVYVALRNSAGTEITARVAVTLGAPVSGRFTATADVTFTANADGTATEAALYTAAAGGDLWWTEHLDDPLPLLSGQQTTSPAADIYFDFSI